MFTYSKEKELHEYIVENFHNYFDFSYTSSEFIVDSGRVDIIGQSNNDIYIIELKRDVITRSTIAQLQGYINDIQLLKPDRTVRGIAAAPSINPSLDVSSLPYNIELKVIDNVQFIPLHPVPNSNTTIPKPGKRKRVTFSFDDMIIDNLKLISDKTVIPQSRLVEQAVKEVIEKYGK